MAPLSIFFCVLWTGCWSCPKAWCKTHHSSNHPSPLVSYCLLYNIDDFFFQDYFSIIRKLKNYLLYLLRQKIHFIFITITINITTFTSSVLCEQSIRSTLIMEGCDCKVTYLLYCTVLYSLKICKVFFRTRFAYIFLHQFLTQGCSRSQVILFALICFLLIFSCWCTSYYLVTCCI